MQGENDMRLDHFFFCLEISACDLKVKGLVKVSRAGTLPVLLIYTLYKNVQAEINENFKNILRTCSG